MPVRSAVGVINQIGIETTPGTLVPANRYLPTLNFNITEDLGAKSFRGSGSRVNTTMVQHKPMAKGNFEGVLDYNSSNYIFAGLFNNPVAEPLGEGTPAYRRVFTAGVRTADTGRKTFSLEDGDQTACDKYSFLQLLGFSLQSGEDDFKISGDFVARYPTLNSTLTASPTAIAERPVERGDVTVYISDTPGFNDIAEITEARNESIELGSKFQEVWFHNRALKSFADIVEIPYAPKFSVEAGYNAQMRSVAAEIRSNPWKYFIWNAAGKLLALDGGDEIYELIQFEMAVKFDSPEKMRNSGEIFAYKLNTEMQADPVAQTHLRITTISSLATL